MRKYETGIAPGKCGIYGIEYKDSGIVYVGKSKDIYSRIKGHIDQSKEFEKSGLFKTGIDSFMGEMGWEYFNFSILIECGLESLDYYEQYYYEKCGGEKLKNIESPKKHAGAGIMYAIPEFLNNRAMYYVCKLIDDECSFTKCINDLYIDYFEKEDELRDNLVRKFGYSLEELENHCKSSRNYGDVIRIICEQKLESALEKVSHIVSLDDSYIFINRETKKFTNKKRVENNIIKHFVDDLKNGILSKKNLNYETYYDKKVAERYYTIAELAKAVTLLEELRNKRKKFEI